MLIWIAVIILAVFLDQLTKYLTVLHIKPMGTLPIIEDVIHLTYVENTGAAFGMLKNARWVFMVASTVMIIALLVYLFGFFPKKRHWAENLFLSLIVAGGIGNMIDRVSLGYVVDMIDFRLINFAVFNVADSFVCVGCGMILVWTLYMEMVAKKPAFDILLGVEPKNAEPQQGAESAGETADEAAAGTTENNGETDDAGDNSAEETTHES